MEVCMKKKLVSFLILMFIFLLGNVYGNASSNIIVFSSYYLPLETPSDMVSNVDESIRNMIKSVRMYNGEFIDFRLTEGNVYELIDVLKDAKSGKEVSKVISNNEFGQFALTSDFLDKVQNATMIIIPNIGRLHVSDFFKHEKEVVYKGVMYGKSEEVVNVPFHGVTLKMNLFIVDPISFSVTNIVIDVYKEIKSDSRSEALNQVISNEVLSKLRDFVGYGFSARVIGMKGNNYVIDAGEDFKVWNGQEFLVFDEKTLKSSKKVNKCANKGVVKVVSVGKNTSEVIPATLFTSVSPGDIVLDNDAFIFMFPFVGFQQVSIYPLEDTNLQNYFDQEWGDSRGGERILLGLGFSFKQFPVDFRAVMYFLVTKPFTSGVSIDFGFPFYLWRFKINPHIGVDDSISFVSLGENYPLIGLRGLYAYIFSVGVLGGVGVEMRIINEFSLYLDVGGKFLVPLGVDIPNYGSLFSSPYVPTFIQRGFYGTFGLEFKFGTF
jgi:hypothetical protein